MTGLKTIRPGFSSGTLMDNIDCLFVPNYMMHVVKLTDVISDQEINIINDLYAMERLQDLKFTNSDTKKAFYFHIINGVCEYIDAQNTPGDVIFYYSACDLKFLELTNYVSVQNIKNFLNTLTAHVNRILPVYFFKSDKCFSHLQQSKSGEGVNTILEIKGICDKKKYAPASFLKIKKFIQQQQFTYLDKKYFSKYKYMMKLV